MAVGVALSITRLDLTARMTRRAKGGRKRRRRDDEEEEEGRLRKRGKQEASESERGDEDDEEDEEEDVEPLWTGEGDPLAGEAWTEEEDAWVSAGSGWACGWACGSPLRLVLCFLVL